MHLIFFLMKVFHPVPHKAYAMPLCPISIVVFSFPFLLLVWSCVWVGASTSSMRVLVFVLASTTEGLTMNRVPAWDLCETRPLAAW